MTCNASLRFGSFFIWGNYDLLQIICSPFYFVPWKTISYLSIPVSWVIVTGDFALLWILIFLIRGQIYKYRIAID